MPNDSITLTPSHKVIPKLWDFLVDQKSKPCPEQAELIQLMQHLNAMDIRSFNVRVKSGIWAVEFTAGKQQMFRGAAKGFAEAVEDALYDVHYQDMN